MNRLINLFYVAFHNRAISTTHCKHALTQALLFIMNIHAVSKNLRFANVTLCWPAGSCLNYSEMRANVRSSDINCIRSFCQLYLIHLLYFQKITFDSRFTLLVIVSFNIFLLLYVQRKFNFFHYCAALKGREQKPPPPPQHGPYLHSLVEFHATAELSVSSNKLTSVLK